MMKNQRRSKADWVKIVAEQERSGLSCKKFCGDRSIGQASFYKWRQRLMEGRAAASPGASSRNEFIEVGKIEAQERNSANVSPWEIALELGDGIRLTLRRG